MSVRIACLWVLIGCGGDDPGERGDGRNPTGETPEGESPEGESPDEEVSTFECYSQAGTCDAGSEFCLESWQGDIAMSGTCAPLPEGCRSCDCVLEQDIEQVWFDTVSETDNCSGAILYCEQQDAAIRVLCQK